MFSKAMVHYFIMTFAEDSQGREACDVVITAQIHLLGTVNLHTVNVACCTFISMHSITGTQAAMTVHSMSDMSCSKSMSVVMTMQRKGQHCLSNDCTPE